jgi:hypothetical protein
LDRDAKKDAHPTQVGDNQRELPTAKPRTGGTVAAEVAFTEVGSATVAALLHLLRLMGSELVMMRGSDLAKFEEAVRTKLEQAASPTINQNARTAGLALARNLVEQVLSQIRAQAEQKKSLTAATVQAAKDPPVQLASARLLN